MHAIEPAELERRRARGQDRFGNRLVERVDEVGGAPLRCCLRDSQPGERITVMAHQPSPRGGPYAETGPVFVHADRCPGWIGRGYPPAFTDRPQVFRAYDHDGTILDARLVEPGDHEGAITELLADESVARIDTRNVLYGCFMATITPAGRSSRSTN